MPLTAFSTPKGHYQFKRLPFGLKKAPTDFNRIMNIVIGRLPYAEVYFDDIIVHSKTFEEHVIHVRSVLEKIKSANLRLKGKKCEWFCKKANVLGHVVSKGQVAMD